MTKKGSLDYFVYKSAPVWLTAKAPSIGTLCNKATFSNYFVGFLFSKILYIIQFNFKCKIWSHFNHSCPILQARSIMRGGGGPRKLNSWWVWPHPLFFGSIKLIEVNCIFLSFCLSRFFGWVCPPHKRCYVPEFVITIWNNTIVGI